ncbi:outer membrane protein [Sphingomicrobium arenosum]|uniref:outer membrane protein n=1 Tax=Sphingomicrobium arenosum TaxID=2233861 RepID=UPI00223F9BA5|nr:outer membrane beta-barrel protein [Sphingomicrobium arenosum]
MLKTSLAAATALGALATATPAAAQFAPSGPRVELQLGSETDLVDLGTEDYDLSGTYLGFGAGYDFSLGVVALGIDVEAGQSNIEEDVAFEDVDGFVTGVIENDTDLYIGGRLTVPVGRLFDLYAKAGYTNLKTVYDLAIDDGETVTYELIEDNEGGYRLGAGGRYYIGRGTYLGGEYRYSRYEDSEINKHQAVATLGIRF